jgi:hypothetical protein
VIRSDAVETVAAALAVLGSIAISIALARIAMYEVLRAARGGRSRRIAE